MSDEMTSTKPDKPAEWLVGAPLREVAAHVEAAGARSSCHASVTRYGKLNRFVFSIWDVNGQAIASLFVQQMTERSSIVSVHPMTSYLDAFVMALSADPPGFIEGILFPGRKSRFYGALNRALSSPTFHYKLFVREISHKLRESGISCDEIDPETSLGPPEVTRDENVRARSMLIEPIFYQRPLLVRDDFCFVIMPFRQEFLDFYEHAIKPVVVSLDLECKIARDFRGASTDVMERVWLDLNEARFLIADLTTANPNVFYELGIANTLGKQIVAIHKQVAPDEEVHLPFDVRTRSTVMYDSSPGGIAVFQKELREHLEAILQSQA